MADKPRIIPFKKNWIQYYWDKASGEVKNAQGEIVATQCYNFQIAKARAKNG